MRYLAGVMVAVVCVAGLIAGAAAQTVQEVRVQWDAYFGAAKPHVVPGSEIASPLFTVLEHRKVPGSPPRQRGSELSSSHLVIVAVNAQGMEIDRQAIHDPRIVRAEQPSSTGEIEGQVLHHASVEFLVSFRNDPAIQELWVYQPRWTGTTFVLEPLGTIRLR